MTRNPAPQSALRQYDPKSLQRELYNRSVVLTRSAHALTMAADQLLGAHGNDTTKSAAEVRTAAFAALLAAVGAFELIGSYDLAGWIERRSRPAPKRAPSE